MLSISNGRIGKRNMHGQKSTYILQLVMPKIKYTFQTTQSQYENIVVK
jgi:hypothetical protein